MSKLELRALKGDDIFVVFELVDKLELIDPLSELMKGNMRKEIIAVAEGEAEEQTDSSIGLEVVIKLAKVAMRNIPKAKVEINNLLGNLTGTDAQTVANLPVKDYFELVKDFFMHNDLQELLESVLPSSESE